MKKIPLYIIPVMLGLILFSSCKKALTEKVYDFVSPNNFYKTEADAVSAINGVYGTLLSYGFYKQNLWAVVDLDADHSSGPSWFLGSIGQGNPRDYWGIDNIWNDHYLMIARANGVLENVPGMSIDEDVKNRVMGEAYFFRAYSYFDLVRLYGGVPIKLHTIATGLETPFMPRSTVMETYNQIISDLKQAEQLLFPAGDPRSGETGRVTRDVASAILAKAYLTIASGSLPSGNLTVNTGSPTTWGSYSFSKIVTAGLEGVNSELYFDSARTKLNEVISGGRYSLFQNWMDLLKNENKNKTEHMFMLNTFNRPDLGTDDFWAYFNAARPDGSNSGWVWTTKNVYDNYEKSDHRALHGFTHQFRVFGTNLYFPQEETQYQTDAQGNSYIWSRDWNNAYTTKYKDATAGPNTVPGANDVHYPLLRYADVLLMFAEAENELNGPTPAAYNALNQIRVRAKASEAPQGMNKEQFRSFVIEERGRELLYENNRRYDLIRWGIYLQVMNKMQVDASDIIKVRSERNLLLPIPLSEINTNEGLGGKNNPGW